MTNQHNSKDSTQEQTPNPEVTERPRRRTYTAEYKLRILDEVTKATEPGQIGIILRREGLYSSHLTDWRHQRDQGAFDALSIKRGRKTTDAVEIENARLRKENQKLTERLARAENVIEVQGKVSALLRELSIESADTKPEP